MTDVNCDDCGRKLGTKEGGYVYNETADGKKICHQCNWNRYQEEENKKELAVRNAQKTLGFMDIPSKTFEYIMQSYGKRPEDTHPKRIPIEDLHKYGTACGAMKNKPFTPQVIKLLKENSPEDFVLGEEYNDELFVLINMVVAWKGTPKQKSKLTYKFDDLVGSNGGSLRAEDCFEGDWDCYESE